MLMTSVTFLYPVGREFPVSVFYTSFDALKASLSVAATSCQIRSFPHHIGCRIPLRKLSFCDSVVDVHLLQCHQTDQHRKIQSNWPPTSVPVVTEFAVALGSALAVRSSWSSNDVFDILTECHTCWDNFILRNFMIWSSSSVILLSYLDALLTPSVAHVLPTSCLLPRFFTHETWWSFSVMASSWARGNA